MTTPQQVSLQVARRGAKMFEKLNIPIIGIVENMSYVKCPSCHSAVNLFGKGTETFAKELNTKILQKFPLLESVNESAEKGVPIIFANSESEESLAYKRLAESLLEYISKIKE